jgi:hypothetical protein
MVVDFKKIGFREFGLDEIVPMAGFSVTCAGRESKIHVTKEHVRIVEIMLRVWNRRLSWRSRSSAVELIEKRLVQINCKSLKILVILR